MKLEKYFIDNLDKAIENEWIKAYHQPLVRAASGKVCDEEAFARWEDPEKGVFNASDFIPVLEKEKLTYKLDLYMAERVLKKMKGQGEHGLFIVPESINLAKSDFECCDMVSEIVKRIDASGLSRDKLSIELSERTISADVDFMKTQIDRFHEAGIRVWMDDYGSGYSSLLILLKVRFDLLKIDKVFIDQIEKNDTGKIILIELIKTAIGLGMDTTAEGVETKAQADFLKEIGCTKLQGYYFTKPISLADIIARNKKGIQIGFENPEEDDYYDKIGKVSLHDLNLSRDDDASLNNYFDTMPMAIFSFDKQNATFIRGNKSFREFASTFLGNIYENTVFPFGSIKPGPGYYTFNCLRKCAQDGKRLIIDDRLSDGRGIQVFMRKIADNPVSGDSAVAVAVLSITDKAVDNLTYNYVARALSSDYLHLYLVNVDTSEFTEYAADGDSRDIAERTKGSDFFNLYRKEFNFDIPEEDKQQLQKDLNKEKVMQEIQKNGIYSIFSRVRVRGTLIYVNIKAVKVRGDGNYIIVGINNVDDQMRTREELNMIKEERKVYSRIAALTGDIVYIYTIDLDNFNYIRYNPSNIISDMGMPEQGDNFFKDALKRIPNGVYKDDVDQVITAFTEENVLNAIKTKGLFENRHRLMIDGKPRYVITRANINKEDGKNRLIVGIIDVDERVKREQKFEKHIFAVENKANIDELTGIKNKHAYADTEKKLNYQIDRKKVSPFAVAVFDINGLKQVNDTKGHQAGDQFIKDGCRIICQYFKHSPVFRIGGDEFAVIVQGDDYNNIDSIMSDFNANNRKNRKKGDVVIAAGVSRYNRDESVSIVFERADEEMYQNKKELKI